MDEIADALMEDERACMILRPAHEALEGDCLDRAGAGALDGVDVRVRLERPRTGPRRPCELEERLEAQLADGGRDGRWAQPVQEAREEQQEEEDSEENESGDQEQAEVRGIRLADLAKEHERVSERPDQDRKDRLQEPVTVDKPHVPRRELARRGLHQEHGHRDDEADEPDHGAENRREHG